MKIINILLILILFSSCQKDFLEKKPSKGLLIPETLGDFQAILDNTTVMNRVMLLSYIACDDMSIYDNGYESLSQPAEKNSYIWSKDIFQGAASSDWNIPYTQVYYANVVLDGIELKTKEEKEQMAFKNIKAAALFYRAFAYYTLSQQFAAPYKSSSSENEKGIPLRLTADINIKIERGTLKQTYEQILKDLHQAKDLLPNSQVENTRPSKIAALGLLARVYLTMQDYNNALEFSNKVLALKSDLIDYNINNPYVENGNSEVIFNCGTNGAYSFVSSSLTGCSKALYDSYDSNDLRKTYFWVDFGSGANSFIGSYSQNIGYFMGIATDEIYLIKAECLARNKSIDDAMSTLNHLMIRRYKSGEFSTFSATNEDEALKLILEERRKEMVCRGTRWTDLRRLNDDPRFKVTLKRVVKGIPYELPPGDRRYVFPIPDNEINGSGIEQN